MSYNGGRYGYGGGYGYARTGYNPFSDPDLKWFLDANFGLFQERTGAAATTPSVADGPVGTWQDLRGTAIYGTATSDAARPTFRVAGFNSRKSVQFDGTDDFLDFTTALTAQFKNANYIYVLVAMAPTNEAVGGEVVRITGNATTVGRCVIATNRGGSAGRLSVQGRILDADALTTRDVASSFTNLESFVATGKFLCAADTMSIDKNGVETGTIAYAGSPGPTSNTNSSAVLLGAGTSASLFFDGHIAGLLAYCRATPFTDAELLARERYLGTLTGEVF